MGKGFVSPAGLEVPPGALPNPHVWAGPLCLGDTRSSKWKSGCSAFLPSPPPALAVSARPRGRGSLPGLPHHPCPQCGHFTCPRGRQHPTMGEDPFLLLVTIKGKSWSHGLCHGGP